MDGDGLETEPAKPGADRLVEIARKIVLVTGVLRRARDGDEAGEPVAEILVEEGAGAGDGAVSGGHLPRVSAKAAAVQTSRGNLDHGGKAGLSGQDRSREVAMRRMVLVGFLQAQNCTQLASSWRHPEARLDFLGADYFKHIGRVLEAGKFQLGFFDDRLAMPDMYGLDHGLIVENGIRCVKMDPVTILMAMGMATERLGLGATYSTTYYEPFHVARVFATLDLMTAGRAAWNVVTSVNDGEAMNMGQVQHLDHDIRYDRADEFMEVVLGHWDTWEDGAIVADRERDVFAVREKVHRLGHEGNFFRSRGPFTVPRSAQGHPVVIQAGSSGRGKRFAARWAELVFVAYPNLAAGRQQYAELKREISRHGRASDEVKIATLIWPVTAATRAEAEDKMAVIEAGYRDVDGLSLLSEALNFDFATKQLDEPFTADELASMTGMHAMRDRVLAVSGKPNPTVRDFLDVTQRGKPSHAVVGGPKEIADNLEEWFTAEACDGFVVSATHIPGSYEDFVRFVVPELQRRGLFHTEYRAQPCAKTSAWRARKSVRCCPRRRDRSDGHVRRNDQLFQRRHQACRRSVPAGRPRRQRAARRHRIVPRLHRRPRALPRRHRTGADRCGLRGADV